MACWSMPVTRVQASREEGRGASPKMHFAGTLMYVRHHTISFFVTGNMAGSTRRASNEILPLIDRCVTVSVESRPGSS